MTIQGDITGKEIAPLLILPFVENCFKHGVSRTAEHAWIHITMEVSDSRLDFVIENSKPAAPELISGNGRRGIGLGNVRKRLELMYPGRYKLSIDDRDHSYQVQLELQWDIRREYEV